MAVLHATAALEDRPGATARPVAYAWVVFALTFGLLISDYMARQVLNAVFPVLKVEWALSDGQLGALSGVVAVMVGVLTFPFSLLADRWGRVRCLTAMAVLWSLATLLCGVARSYEEMFAGRLLVGVGEAAYGSVGIAVVVSVFPKSMRATLSATFMAGGLLGQVLGVGIGGAIAAQHGWRTAFMVIALAGLAMALVYPLVVRERKIAAIGTALGTVEPAGSRVRVPLRALFASRALVCTYIGSGLQLMVAGALPTWLPTYFNRYYAMPLATAATTAALFLGISGLGMVACGMASDRLARGNPVAKFNLAIAYSLGCALALLLAFALPVGPAQLVALGFAALLAAGTSGPAGAMVANLTPLAIHSTAFATLTLANNLLGLAPGPIAIGRIADRIGLAPALQLLPLACLAAAAAFTLASRTYADDLARLQSPD